MNTKRTFDIPFFAPGGTDTPLDPQRMNEIVQRLNVLSRMEVRRGSEAEALIVSEQNAILQLSDDGKGGGESGGDDTDAMHFRGAYNAATAEYALHDVVYTEESGNRILWICVQAHTSATPHTPTYPEPSPTVYWRWLTRPTAGAPVAFTVISHGSDHIVGRPIGGNDDGSDDVLIAKPPPLRFSQSSSTWRGVTVSYAYDQQTATTNQERLATWPTNNSESQMITRPYIAGDLIYASQVAYTGVTVNSVALTWKDDNDAGRVWVKKVITP